MLTGPGADLGTPVIEQKDFVMVTGSSPVERIVAAQAAERLIDCSMELGGQNELLVLEDADLVKARGMAAFHDETFGRWRAPPPQVHQHPDHRHRADPPRRRAPLTARSLLRMGHDGGSTRPAAPSGRSNMSAAPVPALVKHEP